MPLAALPVDTTTLPELPTLDDSPVLTRMPPLEPTLALPVDSSASPEPPLTEEPSAVRRLKEPDCTPPTPLLTDTEPPMLLEDRPAPAVTVTSEPLPSSLEPTDTDTPPA
jgi:hypothetical protein